MRIMLAAAALAAVTWSGAAATPTARPAAHATLNPATHVVKMVLTRDGKYRFQPDSLTIHVGDTVQWVNVSGGPHNVSFYAGKIPDGAAALLKAQMKESIGDLQGKLLLTPNETYSISFAGLPPGEYDYYCTPHEVLGMKGKLIVTK